MQREAHGKDLIPEGRGRAPCLQKDDLPHCCLEFIVECLPRSTDPPDGHPGLLQLQPQDVPANSCSFL